MKRRVLITAIMAAIMVAACNEPLPIQEPSQKEYSRVLIYIGEGFNSLNGYIKEDIRDLIGAPSNALLPSEGSNKAFIVISHLPRSSGNYATATSPTITRISRDYLGRPVCDTLLRMPAGTILTKAENLREALEFVHSEFRSDTYGMIFSSHGTGWLPAGYYGSDDGGSVFSAGRRMTDGAVRYVEPAPADGIDVKSFGQEVVEIDGSLWSYEMSLPSLAAAIPFKFDYIMLDACLMGGIETAYELRDRTRYLAFSQTEILADGLPYKTMLGRLLFETPANVQGVCEDYFKMYDSKTGTYRSATISMVDCTKLAPLAECCRDLFSRYRQQLFNVNPDTVQGFFRFGKHWFYDLEDILVQAGISASDRSKLSAALEDCIVYKAHTDSFMQSFDIRAFCGLSMYLPSSGSAYLDSYYTGLEWDKATGLVL